jgi:hypothetical protein
MDLLFAMMALLLCGGILLPILMRPKLRSAPSCISNLKKVGLFFRTWANENEGRFPMSVSTNKGGSLECVQGGEVFRHFLALSNHLFSPKLLACPEDKERAGLAKWSMDFKDRNLSYFVNLDAEDRRPAMVLAGDRDITGGVLALGNLMLFSSNSIPSWKGAIHKQTGNVVFSDGSAQTLSGPGLLSVFQGMFQGTTNEAARLAIP